MRPSEDMVVPGEVLRVHDGALAAAVGHGLVVDGLAGDDAGGRRGVHDDRRVERRLQHRMVEVGIYVHFSIRKNK